MKNRFLFAFLMVVGNFILPLEAQTFKWLAVGSLHNFYYDIGCEREEVRPGSNQQDGLQWPAVYTFRDAQCAKGLWIGAKNFTNEKNKLYDYKVVHVGPRANGIGEFFPISLKMYSKFDPPQVYVDGAMTYDKDVVNDEIDPTIQGDRMIINVVNMQLGITLTRKIMQYSHKDHDNYHILDFTFENTGNVDGDEEIELPNNTLQDVYFYYQYRYAPCFQSRYIIGNGSGWGINTMNDARGDGASNIASYGDPVDEQFRAQFSWHGYWSDRIPQNYDNIGGPIWDTEYYSLVRGYITEADTVGRLASANFVGVLTLFASDPNSKEEDTPTQPSTTNWIYSNASRTMTNDVENVTWMEEEYGIMSAGNVNPRHAWAAEPTGNFAEQKSELKSDAGYSFGNGYGPYTLGPGESVHIVMVEAVAGLSNEKCIEIGRNYKKGVMDAKTKNQVVLTGRDSLFQTFRRAIANFESDYSLVQVPKPPKMFTVNSGGDRIALTWDLYEPDPNIKGFKIYRTYNSYHDHFQTDQLIYEAKPNELSYDDLTPIRGVGYYYYLVIDYGNDVTSSRYYTQTYDPAFLTRPAGKKSSDIRIVPNPYIISSSADRLRFGSNENDKLAFFNIPGQCSIKIYTELGELIYTLEHTNGSGDDYWNCVTSSNQVIVSGIYIAVVTNNGTGEKETLKFVVIR